MTPDAHPVGVDQSTLNFRSSNGLAAAEHNRETRVVVAAAAAVAVVAVVTLHRPTVVANALTEAVVVAAKDYFQDLTDELLRYDTKPAQMVPSAEVAAEVQTPAVDTTAAYFQGREEPWVFEGSVTQMTLWTRSVTVAEVGFGCKTGSLRWAVC